MKDVNPDQALNQYSHYGALKIERITDKAHVKPEPKPEPETKKPEVKPEPKPEAPKTPEVSSGKYNEAALAEAVKIIKSLDIGKDNFNTGGGISHSGADKTIGDQELANISTKSAKGGTWGDQNREQNLKRNYDLSFKLDLDKDGKISQDEINAVISKVKKDGTEIDQAAFEKAFREGNAALPRPQIDRNSQLKP